jgi:hypothetical protein
MYGWVVVCLTVLVRFVRTIFRLIPAHLPLIPVFLLSSPIILLSLGFWGVGFAKSRQGHEPLYPAAGS